MPTLKRWFEGEYRRLEADGKAALTTRFEAFMDAFFEGKDQIALSSLPDLLMLADSFGEPVWRTIISYYAANAQMHWLGDLSQAIDTATQAVIDALPGTVPALYARETLLYAWLGTDAPGTCADVQAAAAETSPRMLPPDLAARFKLINAHCLAASGDVSKGRDMALSAITALDWPAAHREGMQANVLMWQQRWRDAASLYEHAAQSFGEMGHTIDRHAAQLGRAEALFHARKLDKALSLLLDTLEASRETVNKAHTGIAQGWIGRVLLAQNHPDEALAWLDASLNTLDGLGWMREEATLSIERVKAIRANGAGLAQATREAASADAAWRVNRLRSRDLAAELESLNGDGAL